MGFSLLRKSNVLNRAYPSHIKEEPDFSDSSKDASANASPNYYLYYTTPPTNMQELYKIF